MHLALQGRSTALTAVLATALSVLLAFGAASARAEVISAGDDFSCAVNAAGGGQCWGDGSVGQLGDGDYGVDHNAGAPTDVSVIPGVIPGGAVLSAITAGGLHACAIVAGGAWCWGEGSRGQLGRGSEIGAVSPAVQPIDASGGVTLIDAGFEHTCAVISNTVKCWGHAHYGRLGDDQTGFGTHVKSPVPVQGLPAEGAATAISAGFEHSCAVVAGKAWCWGRGTYGRLGNDDTAMQKKAVAVDDDAMTGSVTAISAGQDHTCAVAAGEAWCWGENEAGQVGDGTDEDRQVPTKVTIPGNPVVSAISAGREHSCAVASGAVWCWGDGSDGKLGQGIAASSLTPVAAAAAGAGATAISADGNHTCAAVADTVKCWGRGTDGQLGLGTVLPYEQEDPVDVLGLGSGVTDIAAFSEHACAVVSGQPRCWGVGTYGQLGHGQIGAGVVSASPVAPSGLTTASAVAVGRDHSCAVSAGSIKCWGRNFYHQLGNASGDSAVPTNVNATGGTAIAAGDAHSCAIISGEAKCWGADYYGQLGNAENTIYVNSPNTVSPPPPSTPTAITAGSNHTCALGGGGLWCWGRNGDGQLGDDTLSQRTSPVVTIAAGGGVSAVDAGDNHTCAVKSGEAWCWGDNQQNQVNSSGDYTVDVPTKVTLPGDPVVTAIAAGAIHTCAVAGGGVVCWGDYQSPYAVSSLSSGVVDITAGDDFTCATLTSGAAKCWGVAEFGQLGNGQTTFAAEPTIVPGIAPLDGTPPANPGGGGSGSGGAGNGTPSAPAGPASVTASLKRSGKAKVKRGKVSFGALASFKLPAGATADQACKGKVSASIKLKGVKKPVRASAKLKSKDATCQALLKFKLAEKFKGKKVKVVLSFSGNAAVAKFSKKVSYKI